MSFAKRHGYVEEKPIQLDSMDSTLRHRLYNLVRKYLKVEPDNDKAVSYVVDKLGYIVDLNTSNNWVRMNSLLVPATTNVPWYMPYEIIEYIFEAKRQKCSSCGRKCIQSGFTCSDYVWFIVVTQRVNEVLEQEKSGYRFIEDKFVNISNSTEVEAITSATATPFDSVNTHIKKALLLYADRDNPDYENSIKESISAVEAMCCIITGMSGASATLGAALKKLEENGVVIHAAMRESFNKLYGYTSDASGIRHGGIDFTNAPAEDAKYMLVSCSAFVNYLTEKYGKVSKH